MTITVTLPAALVPISATRQFSAYSPSHLAVLVIFAIGSAALVWIGRRAVVIFAVVFAHHARN